MDDKVPNDQAPEVEFVYVGTPFTKILENVVSQDKAVVKRANFSHLGLAPETSLVSKRKQREANRLHGAFTGGFSAGYFNTVGTKEGWSTTSFKSSRDSRAGAVQQAPETFMDEEDLGEFGIAPRQITLASDFTTAPAAATKLSRLAQDDQLLSQLLQPVKLTFGAKLYRRQLHKGAKLQLDKNSAENQRVYGCAMPQIAADTVEDDVDDDDDKELAAFNRIVADARKQMSYTTNNSKLFGLGYSSLAGDHDATIFGRSDAELSLLHADKNVRMEAIGGRKPVGRGRGKPQGITGFAFGTGVGEDDDDNDFNNITNLLGYDDRNQYDFAIGGSGAQLEKAARGSNEVEFERGKNSAKVLREVFKGPVVPKDWVPMHIGKETAAPPPSTSDGHRLNVLERAAQLQEDYPVSVLMSDSQRQKLKPKSSEKESDRHRHHHHSSSDDQHRRRQSDDRRRDQVKQEEKVDIKPAKGDLFYTRKIETDQVLDWETETGTGALRSHLYQPMLAQIQSRFTKGGMVSDNAVVKGSQPEAESEQMGAVRMNMFGKLTRTSFDWHPDRLLCKRFNVPHPYPESELVGTVGTGKVKKEKNSSDFTKSSAGMGFSSTQEEVRGKELATKRESTDRHHKSHSSHRHSRFDEKPTVEEEAKPQVDVFEPICSDPDLFAKVFALSDTEDEQSDAEESPDEAEPLRQSLLAKLSNNKKTFQPMTTETPSNGLRLTAQIKQEPIVESSASGSAMDFEITFAKLKREPIEEEKQQKEPGEEDLYGPPLPPMEFLEQPVVVNSKTVEDSDRRSHKKKRRKSRSTSTPRRESRSASPSSRRRQSRKEASRSHSRSRKHKSSHRH